MSDIRFAAKCWVYSLVSCVKVWGEVVRLTQTWHKILLILLTLCTSPCYTFSCKEYVCYNHHTTTTSSTIQPSLLPFYDHHRTIITSTLQPSLLSIVITIIINHHTTISITTIQLSLLPSFNHHITVVIAIIQPPLIPPHYHNYNHQR